MKPSLNAESTESIFAKLTKANQDFNLFYPGESPARQPVHTVYGGAQIFKSDSAEKLGQLSLKAFEDYAADFCVLAKALELPGHQTLPEDEESILKLEKALKTDLRAVQEINKAAALAFQVHRRVHEKLCREPVEDFRIDFEDGYGNRPDEEEDKHAAQAAEEVVKGMKEKTLPPFIGIRIKPFNEELRLRSYRTLDIFLSTLLSHSGAKLPDNFVVTIPKVVIKEQVEAFVDLLSLLEEKLGLPPGSVKIELMIEQTQTIIGSTGYCPVPELVKAAKGRCIAAHFGTYDYTASCNITASHQRMDHPACDFARNALKVSLGGTGIWLSDGATNVMPVGPHRQTKDGPALTFEQLKENRAVVHKAWKLSYGHIQHSLINGYYQGWDLHPAQLPVRYAALYTFFLEGVEAASLRLRSFMEKAAQATLVGEVFDDAATGQGLLNYFLRALNCGAITEEEVRETGLSLDEIRSRSFVKILNCRRQKESIKSK